MMTVYTKSYAPPAIREGEILRYAGATAKTPALAQLFFECIAELGEGLSYRVCYTELPVSCSEAGLDLGFVRSPSQDLAKALAGCRRALLFAATVGVGVDRLIAKYKSLSPSRALAFQAIGTERVESLCDAFEGEMRALFAREGAVVRPRFSPGYGDLPLAMQREIFSVLGCAGRIGVTLNESLLMSPSKSVTAFIGIQDSH